MDHTEAMRSSAPPAATAAPRLRVLMLITELGYGGAESAFLRLANQLAKTAHVTIALFARTYQGGNYTAHPQLAGSAFDGEIVVLDAGPQPSFRALAPVARWARRFTRLSELKRKHDVAISFLSGPNLLNALTPGALTIVSERGSKRADIGVPPLKRWIWTRVLDALAYRRAHAVVAASAGLAGEIAEAHPGLSEKVLAIEGTVHADLLLAAADQPVETEFERFDDYRTLMACGRMHEQKGYDFLIRAFATVRSCQPDARLLLIGDGPRQAEYLLLARSLGLRAGTQIDPSLEDVSFAGYRPAPLRYFRLAHAWAMTSRYEGLPNGLIEALAAGVPVLAADCPWGPRSVLAAGVEERESIPRAVSAPIQLRHGLLMPRVDAPGAHATWASAIESALLAPRCRRPVAPRTEAIHRFDISETAPRWLALLSRLAPSPAPSSIGVPQHD